MTEKNVDEALQNEMLNFSWPVAFTNAVLQELGERPHIRVANLVAFIRQQGEPQFKALLEKYEKEEAKKDE